MGFGLHKLRFALKHPLSKNQRLKTIQRFFGWKLIKTITPYPILYPFVEGTSLVVNKNIPGDEMNFYTGLSEFPEMAFILHYLRESDLFVDIGANVGSFSVLASGVRKCQSITIEPIPSTFKIVMNNILVNDLKDKVIPLNIGIGEKQSVLKFTNNASDVLNHVLTTEEEEKEAYINVPVESLDVVLKDLFPSIFKIDVEGFEMNALLGARNILKKDSLKAILIELNELGKRYGHSDIDIHNYISGYGFKPYSYEPFSRSLKEETSYITPNTIYVRDVEFVNQRLKEAKHITVLGTRF